MADSMPAAAPDPATGIRVVLAGVPGLLGAVVRAVIETQSDMAIVAELEGPEELMGAVAAKRVDVVVTTSAGLRENPALQELFFASAGAPIVAVGAEGRDLTLYARGTTREVSPDHLAAAIRQVAMPFPNDLVTSPPSARPQ